MSGSSEKIVYEHGWPSKPMSITGRVGVEKERLSGEMTSEERLWRMKWLKDQNLTPREPLYIPADHPSLLNPIRKFYRKPLDVLFYKVLQPYIGEAPAFYGRFYTGRILLGLWGVLATFYYFKYNTHSWEGHGRWRVVTTRKATLPGDPDYPSLITKTKGEEYADAGFKSSIFGNSDYVPMRLRD